MRAAKALAAAYPGLGVTAKDVGKFGTKQPGLECEAAAAGGGGGIMTTTGVRAGRVWDEGPGGPTPPHACNKPCHS
jgi:hypothetical protein